MRTTTDFEGKLASAILNTIAKASGTPRDVALHHPEIISALLHTLALLLMMSPPGARSDAMLDALGERVRRRIDELQDQPGMQDFVDRFSGEGGHA
jgi:hypothetical protein